MTSVKITDLTAYADAASTDVLPIVDVGADVTKKIAIGDIVKAVPQGTAALPGLAFDGDPNTGVTSPGADQLAFSTNGTGRLFIDASGNVGINESSPLFPLVVRSPGTCVQQFKRATTVLGFIGEADQIITGGLTTDLAVKADGNLVFGAGSLSERMRIDSSGRLLVGTSSWYNIPDNRFGQNWSQGQQIKVTDNFGAYGGLAIISSSNTVNERVADIALCRQNSSSDYAALINGSTIGSVTFNGADGTKFVRAASIRAEVDGTPGTDDMPGRLVFSTTADGASSPTERMRILNSGKILFGTTTVGYGSQNGFTFEPVGNSYQTISHPNGASSGTEYIAFGYNGGLIGSITQNGTTAVAYNTSSDYRLKENIAPLTGAIGRLNQLQVHRFNFIADPDRTVDGFIAHEAQAVVPECVTGTKDEVDADGNPIYQGIDQSKLVPLLTAALQEALAEIESLKARLTAAGL